MNARHRTRSGQADLELCASLGVRDDGYHLIDAEMVTLDWHDTLTIDPTATGLSADGPFAAGHADR